MENLKDQDFILTPTPNLEASALIRKKPLVVRRVFDKLTPELKCLAFTITGIESMDVLEFVRNEIAKLPKGKDWDSCKAEIKKALAPYLNEKTSATRAELLLRMHGLNAYRVGQWELAQETKDSLPYFKYIATMDSKTRESHAALNGLVLPVDDPFWDGHMPPGWDWFCRCQVVQISEFEKDEQVQAEKKLPPERRRVLDEHQRKELRSGRITTGPSSFVSVKSSFDKGTGVTSLKNLRMSPKDVLERFSSETQADFLNKIGDEFIGGLKDKFSVCDWFLGVKKMPTPLNMLSYKEKLKAFDRIILRKDALDTDEIAEKGRAFFMLPMAKQGSVEFNYINTSPEEIAILEKGRSEIESFISKNVLSKIETVPNIQVQILENARSFYKNGTIYIQLSHQVNKLNALVNHKVLAHEFCHFLEDKDVSILKSCVAFLKKRIGNEKVQNLHDLKGVIYEINEYGFQDSWEERGGSIYSGKFYPNFSATEVLSVGIERFLKNPILFYKQDKDYFEFIVKLIQGDEL